MKDYLEIAHRALDRGVVGRGDDDGRYGNTLRDGGAPESASAGGASRPPSRFAVSRLSCRVRSALLGEEVVFAGDKAVVPGAWDGLLVYRGMDLLALLDASPEHAREIHQAKKLFAATVESYRPGGEARVVQS
jgi:hypothetical protein